MGPEVPGQLAIWLALALNVLAGIAFILTARGREDMRSVATRAYYAFVAFTVLAVADLFYLLFTHNYAFKYIYQYSERSQPFFYILSAFWGGQEGTYLLWLLMTSLWGLLILRRGGRYTASSMAVYSLVNLFLLVLLVKLSPFALMAQVAPDGLGLNHLLRDPWMVIHPPVMFMGFAVTAVPFALAMAAMIQNDYTDWVKRALPWVGTAALFLAAGNIMGGYWAYKTLGWGGYWAWDPVENTSMVPWLTSLALLHGLIIERRSGALRKTNMLLASFLFLQVVYGTFLTRSGVLADFSVHSFTDLGINSNLVFFMGLFVVLTIGVFAWRARDIESKPIDYNFFGKELSLVVSVIILFLFALIVLFWSSLPILSGWFSDEPRAAEIATYNSFAVPLAILMALMVTVVPLAKYGGYQVDAFGKKAWSALAVTTLIGFGLFYMILDASLVFAGLFSLVTGGMVIYLFNPEFRKPLIPALALFVVTLTVALLAGVTDYLILLFFATAAMAAMANVIYLAGFIPGRIKYMSAPLTHFGFGIMLVGVMASSAFDTYERLSIPMGETSEAEKYGVTLAYHGMENEIEHPNNELLLDLDEGSGPREVRPQLYYSQRMDGIMRRPFISRSLAYDLYLAPQQIMGPDQSNGLVLAQGETKEIGGLAIGFTGFDITGAEDMSAGELMVIANLDVSHGDETFAVAPRVRQVKDEYGKATVLWEPAELQIDDKTYEVKIAQISAERNMVVLEIPGLTSDDTAEKLIIDVSKKPMISLVWVGTTLMVFGAIMSVYRRRTELVKTDK